MATLETWREQIERLRFRHPRGPEIRIVTGSLDKFVAACERQLGYAMREASSPKDGVSSAMFMGLDVVKHPYVPENRAVLMRGDDIVAIINLED